jgi:hypothetical protein
VFLKAVSQHQCYTSCLHQTPHRKSIEEPIKTSEDVEFSQEEIRQTIESFNDKKAPGIDGITGGIYLRTFTIFPELVTTIYNQCLQRGCFRKRWKIAKVIPTIKTRARKQHGSI